MESGKYSSIEISKGRTSISEPSTDYVIFRDELKLTNSGQLDLLLALSDRGFSLRTAVCGESMHPFVRDKDILTIEPLLYRRPRIGEIVAFIHPLRKKLVIHRVVARKNDEWLLKGDNVPESDGMVPYENILGIVVRIEHKNKKGSSVFLKGINGALIAFLSIHNILVPIVKIVITSLKVVRNLFNK